MPWRHLVLCLCAVLLLGGCLSAEKKMILKVERFLEQEKYDDALSYLERYLGKNRKSLTGWRYRVLIRLQQEDRPEAAAEYAALEEALDRHEPEVLREVVLGAGGRWLLSDYRALARCAPEGVADAGFFAELVEPKHLGQGSMSKVAVSTDEKGAVIDALPGSLPPGETWTVIRGFVGDPDPRLGARVVRAAGRHLAAGGLSEAATGEALAVLREAVVAGDPELREAALLATFDIPDGPGRVDFTGGLLAGLAVAGDLQRAVSLFLMGPGAGGPAAWPDALLTEWAEGAEGPLRILAVSQLFSREPKTSRGQLLTRIGQSGSAEERLAVVAGGQHDRRGTVTEVWAGLSTEQRRVWGPAFIRTFGPERGLWVGVILGATDAVLTQAAAGALALPRVGDDEAVDPHLAAAMKTMDPTTRAAAGRAVVVREAVGLAAPLGILFGQGQDRVMNEVLQGLALTGNPIWQPLVAQGLQADLPMIRELAVDAAVASCREEDRELMLGLLDDEDPHVAVRAASALYLLVGARTK